MPPYIRNFRGKMDLDNDPYRVSDADYIEAYNITRDSKGDGQDKVVANIVGNVLYNYVLEAGENKVIGSKEDLVRNRMYYFIWNENGYHTILYFDNVVKNVVKVLQSITDCYLGEDILQFNPSYKINHIDIIYRDEGDLIYWTDGLSMPKCIDIAYINSFSSSDIRVTDIEMAKQPPSIPPFCWFQDDTSVTVNNLRKNLFKFKLRYVYEDLTKSVTSSQGALPLPIGENVLTDAPSKNAKISIAFTTGEKNVTKIEILASNNIGNIFSDYFLIKSIDKEELTLGDNIVYIYDFFNNEAYNNIDSKESIQLFDYIPNKSFTQASANGNTIEYANMLEGYDNPSAGDSIVVTGNLYSYQNYKTGNVSVYQNGDSVNVLNNYDIQIVAFGLIGISDILIETTNESIYYNNTSIKTYDVFLNDLASVAALLGFTTSISGNILTINKSNEILNYFVYNGNDASLLLNDFNSSLPCYDWWTRYSYGIVFFDKKGKTNGVIFPLSNSFQTSEYTTSEAPSGNYRPMLPSVITDIDLTTPDWAYSYQIVRTKRLNKGYFIQWISEITIKEVSGGTLNQSYAYIGINSLDAFISENPSSSFLAYSFTVKDRIRFIANGMQSDGSSTNIYTDKDFEILDYVANPTINGIAYTGKYIKIALPTTSGSFDFGTADFYNYFLEVYKPVSPVSDNLDVYYEFGIMDKCKPSTSILKTFQTNIGDCYGRFRDINVVPKLKWASDGSYTLNVGSFPATAGSATLALNKSGISYYNNSYLPYNQIGNDNNIPANAYILKITDGLAHTFNINGNLYLENVSGIASIYIYATDGVSNLANQNLLSLLAINGDNVISTSITAPIGTTQLYIAYYGIGQITVTNGSIAILENNKVFRQFCIDPNFSDYYQSAVNSDGRAFVYDENAKQQWFPTTIRFSREYQQNTNINQTNRFYEDNFDDYDRGAGSIQKLFVDGRRLYTMQQFNIGIVPILQQVVQDTTGNPLQAQSDILLNKIQYPFQGKIGIGTVPESFAYHNRRLYGIDNNRGIAWRVSQDGLTELSVIYECDAFFKRQCLAYAKTLNNGYGALGQVYKGDPSIYATFDNYTNKVVWAFEEINRYDRFGNLIFHQDPKTIIFNESHDESEGFECFTNYFPEGLNCLGTLLVSFKDGQIWTHDNQDYCNFFGTQYDASITVVFNGNPYEKKNYQTLSQIASKVWDCPSITTQAKSYGTTPQQSSLIEQDFLDLEGTFEANFLRDSNSIGGLLGGDGLYGHYIVIKFRKENADTFVFLNNVVITALNSPLTTK